ncbi:MAG: hypothetical protein PHI00_05600, partial [Atribacterota bacterium]|nr:hypothetical protein [Atribacterota bacterium]
PFNRVLLIIQVIILFNYQCGLIEQSTTFSSSSLRKAAKYYIVSTSLSFTIMNEGGLSLPPSSFRRKS